MSCRSTPATSAATTFARLNCSLTDVQTLSAFHALRAQAPRHAEDPSRAEWREWVETETTYIEAHPNLTDARRRSLLNRMQEAAKQPLPDGRTWSALRRIRAHTQAQSTALDAAYLSLAGDLGEPVETVRAEAARLMAQVDTARNATAPEGYSDLAARQFRNDNLPVDRQTVHALTMLRRRALTAARNRRSAGERRVVRQRINSTAIREVGYDPDGGRLEVVFASHPDRVHAYRNVPQSVYEDMVHGSAGRTWHTQIRNNARYRYSTTQAAEEDAYRVQCPTCGQFRSRTGGHTCPTSGGVVPPPQRASDLTSRVPVTDPVTGMLVALPHPHEITQAAADGPVTIPLRHTGTMQEDHGSTQNFYELAGEIRFTGDENSGLTVDLRQARCSCFDYRSGGTCPHLTAYAASALRAVNPERASVEDAARLQHEVEAALRADWMRSRKYARVAATQWQQSAEVSYVEDPAAFDSTVRRAEQQWQAGVNPVPYLVENATDGLLTREAERGFGVEIEFDFPDSMSMVERSEALHRIGAALHDAGLTTSPFQQEYHTAGDTGYSDDHAGGWSFEQDVTVAGEIVSPVMYDEPETWQNLQRVCDIVRAHGGVASARTGSHVHVSSTWFGSDVQNYTELLRMVNQHEDVLYRLATDPRSETGEHRPTRYCAPNPEIPLAGYGSLDRVLDAHDGHEHGLNLQSVTGARQDHVEFRQWDGTLDPALIQAQVKMSAGLMAAATARNGSSPHRPREPLGAHWTRNVAHLDGTPRALSDEERLADSATTRSFIDTLFTRRADKEQIAALFAITGWQRRSPGRGGAATRALRQDDAA